MGILLDDFDQKNVHVLAFLQEDVLIWRSLVFNSRLNIIDDENLVLEVIVFEHELNNVSNTNIN